MCIDWKLLATFVFSLISLTILHALQIHAYGLALSAIFTRRLLLGIAAQTLIVGTLLWAAWIRFATPGPGDGPSSRLRRQSWGWVRLLFGILLILLLVQTTLQELSGGGHGMFRFSNSDQLAGGMIANAIVFMLEFWLAWSGFVRIYTPPEPTALDPPQP